MEQRTANIKSANSTAQTQLRLPPANSFPGLQPGSQRPASSIERQHKRRRTAIDPKTGASIAAACVVGIASEGEGEVRVLGPPLEETLGYTSPWPPPSLAACLPPAALTAVHPPSPSQPPPLCDPSPNLTPEDCDDGGVSLCDPVSSAYVYQQVHDMVCQMQRMTSQMAMLLEYLGPLHASLTAGPAAPSHHTKRHAAARCRSPPPPPQQHQPDPHAPTSMQGPAQGCSHPYPWGSSSLPLPQPLPSRLPKQQQRHHHHPQQQFQICQQQQDSRALPPQQQQQQQDKLDQVMQALPPQQQRTARHRAQRSPPPTSHPSLTPPPMPHQEPMQVTGAVSPTAPHTTATTAATTSATTAAAAAATPLAAAAGCAGAPSSRSPAGAGRQVQEAEAAAVEALLLQAAACCPPQPHGSGRRTSGLDQLAMAATAAPTTISPWSPPTPHPLPQPPPPQPPPATQPLALDGAQLSKQQRGDPLLEGHKRGGPGTQPQSPSLLLPSDPPCNPPTLHHEPRSPGPQTLPPSPHPPDISHSPPPRVSCPSPPPLTSTSRSAVQASQLTQASRDEPGQVLLPAPLLPPPAAASSSAAQSLTRASTPSPQTRGATRCQPGAAADAGAVAAVAAAAGRTAGVVAEAGTQARQQQGLAAAPQPAPNQADPAAGKSWPTGPPGSGVLGTPLEGSDAQGARPPCPVKVEPEPCLGAEPPGLLAACPHSPKGLWAGPLLPQGQEGALLRQGPRGGPGARGGCQTADSGEGCDVPLGAMQAEGQLGGRRSPGGEQLDLGKGEGERQEEGEGQGEGEQQEEGEGQGQEEGLEEGEGERLGQQQVDASTVAPGDSELTGPWQLCDSMAFFKQLMESQPQPQLQPQPQPQLQLQTQQQPQLQLQPQQRLMAQVPDELHCDASAAANTSLAVGHGSRPAPGWPQAVGSWPVSLTSPPTQHQPSQQQPFHLQQQPVLQLSGASNAGTQQQLHSLLQQLRRSKQEKPARNDRNPPKPGTVAALLGRAPSLRDSVASQVQFGPSGRSGFTPPDSACRTTVNNGARVFQTNGITPAHVKPCADDGLEAGGRAGDDSGAGEEGSAIGIYKQRRRGNAGRDEQETNSEGDMLSSDRHQRGSFQRRINKSMLQEVYHLPIQEAAQHLRMGVTVLKKYCRSFKVERWPFRKLQSLDKLIQSVQEQQAMEPSIDLTFALSELQRCKAEVYDTPEVALDERIKRLRQANFKQDYKQRQVFPSPGTLPSPPLGPPGRAPSHEHTVTSSPPPSLTLSPRSPQPPAPSPSPPLTALHQPRAAGQPARPTLPRSPDAWPAPSLAVSRPGPSTHPLVPHSPPPYTSRLPAPSPSTAVPAPLPHGWAGGARGHHAGRGQAGWPPAPPPSWPLPGLPGQSGAAGPPPPQAPPGSGRAAGSWASQVDQGLSPGWGPKPGHGGRITPWSNAAVEETGL